MHGFTRGYDDARAALMEVIASTLGEEAEKRKKGVDKAKEFLERINWFRAAKLVTGSAVALSLGMPPVGLLGDIWRVGKNAVAGKIDEEMQSTADEVAGAASGLFSAKAY